MLDASSSPQAQKLVRRLLSLVRADQAFWTSEPKQGSDDWYKMRSLRHELEKARLAVQQLYEAQ